MLIYLILLFREALWGKFSWYFWRVSSVRFKIWNDGLITYYDTTDLEDKSWIQNIVFSDLWVYPRNRVPSPWLRICFACSKPEIFRGYWCTLYTGTDDSLNGRTTARHMTPFKKTQFLDTKYILFAVDPYQISECRI